MIIKVYRSFFGGWLPTAEMWEKHRQILIPLCIGGNIAYKTKEGITTFFADNGIKAVEEGSTDDMGESEQLMLF